MYLFASFAGLGFGVTRCENFDCHCVSLDVITVDVYLNAFYLKAMLRRTARFFFLFSLLFLSVLLLGVL